MNARVRPATAVDPPAQAACANGGTCERDICPAAAWSQVPTLRFRAGNPLLALQPDESSAANKNCTM
jgi:hypothetical protein